MYHETTAPRPEPRTTGIAAPVKEVPPADDRRLVIESRFGTLAVSAENAVVFPKGLLGFGEFRKYVLAEIPDPRYPQFRVLQCLDNHDLAFLVLPLDPASGILDPADIAAACKKLSIDTDVLALLLVVTIRKGADDEIRVSANLRAPLLIDSAQRIGVQYVLPNDSYPVRHPI